MSALTLDGLPGEELIREGLSDGAKGVESVASLLVEIAEPRLTACGIHQPKRATAAVDAEIRLHHLLVATSGRDAYGQYNALLRRLVSFERALEHRFRRAEGN